MSLVNFVQKKAPNNGALLKNSYKDYSSETSTLRPGPIVLAKCTDLM